MSVLRSERLPPILLAAFAALGALPVVRSLLVADVNWCYPYLTSDSYDWINNGMFWAGEAVLPSLRPPGFPLVIAALWRLGALPLLPVANFLFLGLSTASLYLLLRERHDAWIAAFACWFFFANGYVQDFSRYLMAETYGTPFLVLATLAFVRAERAPRAWIALGLCLGVGFLFSYAAAPAAIGFGLATLVVSRRDVRRWELWMGLLAAGLVAGSWFAFRWWSYRARPGGQHNAVEALFRPSFANAGFYLYATTALIGLIPIFLYLAGALRLAGLSTAPRFRAAVLGPLLALSVFWCFLYDWADKRFLLYLLPFLVCFLAEGLASLREFARDGRVPAAAAIAFLLLALLWNQIRYPSYGIQYLALTPRHFLEAVGTMTPAYKTELHLKGSRVVSVHESLLAAFSRGLFDARVPPRGCALTAPEFRCLGEIRREADRLLRRGEPIGLYTPKVWPVDYYVATNRLSNLLLRPVVLPDQAAVTFGGSEVPHVPPLAACGPYVLVRTR